jgi:protein bicaudal D
LTEEVDLLNQQVEELSSLKAISEKQLEEALESLQAEREHRHQLRKELEIKANADNMFQLGNLALSMQQVKKARISLPYYSQSISSDTPSSYTFHQGNSAGDSEATDGDEPSSGKEGSLGDDDEEDIPPALRGGNHTSGNGPPSDLFSEIHGGEIRKLERRAELAEAEKAKLTEALSESRSAAERAGAASKSAAANAARLSGLVAGLERLQEEGSLSEVVSKQLSQLRAALRDLEASGGETGEDSGDGLNKLKSEVIFFSAASKSKKISSQLL